jgi:hypothetical protein
MHWLTRCECRLGSLAEVDERTPILGDMRGMGSPIVEFTFRYRPLGLRRSGFSSASCCWTDYHAAILKANEIAPAPALAPETLLPSATVVDREVEATAESTKIVVKQEEQAHDLSQDHTKVSEGGFTSHKHTIVGGRTLNVHFPCCSTNLPNLLSKSETKKRQICQAKLWTLRRRLLLKAQLKPARHRHPSLSGNVLYHHLHLSSTPRPDLLPKAN